MNSPEIYIQFNEKYADKVTTLGYLNYTFPNSNICLHDFRALKFLSIRNGYQLANITKLSVDEIQQLIDKPVYRKCSIPKSKGGFRDIYIPEDKLKSVQFIMNVYLQSYYFCIKPDEIKGFVKRNFNLYSKQLSVLVNNIYDNAIPHVNKKILLNIDIKDFFSSINSKDVYKLFRSSLFSFNEHIALALTFLTTYNGILPTGSPSSPIISNFICYEMDKKIIEFCRERRIAYTRYADDLSFSSNYQISDNDILDLINIIKNYGFQPNFNKVRIARKRSRQVVTGLLVNEKVNVSRKLIRKVRAMLHDYSKNGLEKATVKHFALSDNEATEQYKMKFKNRLFGYISFIGQIRGKSDSCYKKFINEFEFNTKKEEPSVIH